ncbi:MAG: hypothetical protein M3336_02860 [Chloroflexota bacterium]|nr:hypothetical protein [Chloroflexota bacterium]
MITIESHDPRWFDFVQSCPNASPFHHPSWANLLEECYHYRSFVLASTDSHGRITAGLPVMDVSSRFTGRRWVALPFTDYCPMVQSDQATGDLVDALVRELD